MSKVEIILLMVGLFVFLVFLFHLFTKVDRKQVDIFDDDRELLDQYKTKFAEKKEEKKPIVKTFEVKEEQYYHKEETDKKPKIMKAEDYFKDR